MADRQRSPEDAAIFRRTISATRLHLPPDTEEIPEATIEHLRQYAEGVQQLGVVAAIAVNSHEAEVRRIAREAAPGLEVNVLPVPCWGAFVPALNALLSFAQRSGMKYILYQSLEVRCTAAVLERLLDFHTADTLVVGPTFNGHDFRAGEQPLNGRSTPWNTLALWSVRKLALTGFLNIADGLPGVGEHALGQVNPQEPDGSSGPMGSDDWWNSETGLNRQLSSLPTGVPAGVEEVTAIALLQHLHGSDRARAVLVQLPTDLEAQLSWSASWGQDERRAKWHKYKMESKVSRPAAQLHELFKFQRISKTMSTPNLSALRPSSSMTTCIRRRPSVDDLAATRMQLQQSPSEGLDDAESKDTAESGPLQFGVVMHYGDSIRPPPQVLAICLASLGLFYANSAAVLADAFRLINTTVGASASSLAHIALLLGGVFLPMPLSLWLFRQVTRRSNHRAGLVLFGSCLLLSHFCIVLSQLLFPGPVALLLGRLVQGFGSGILFQVRFVMGQLSTCDQHVSLQTSNFLMSDLGLGLGALLPPFLTWVSGGHELSSEAPELWTSAVLALASLAYLIWVIAVFPRRCAFLPHRVRFAGAEQSTRLRADFDTSDRITRLKLWISGTTRVFVQSAILPAAALSMRDAKWTGNFRQTLAVAAICLLPMPFEALVSRMCCSCSLRLRTKDGDFSKMVSGAVGLGALLLASIQPRSRSGEDGEFLTMLSRICELGTLMVALGMAAPFNASRLLQQKDAERCIVLLEWMKAYIGRLLGPIFAVLFYHWAGYRALLGVLCCATAMVTFTA